MERLRQLRKGKGLTQQQMADTLGVDRTTYTKYENGASEPNIATLRQLAAIFGVTLDYLLGVTDEPTALAPIASFTALGDVPLSDLSEAEQEELANYAVYLLSKRKHPQ